MSENNINYPAPFPNEVPVIADIELPASTATGVPVEQRNFIQHGDGTQIGEVDGDVNITNNINVTDEQLKRVLTDIFKGSIPVSVPDNSGTPSNTSVRNTASRPASPAPRFVSHAMEWASLNRESYNLFVLENEDYNNGSFCISKGCALRYTEQDDYDAYHLLKMDDIERIKHMPCIFAKRNTYYGRTDAYQPLVFGRIIDVINQGDIIKFVFQGFQANPQQQLNENAAEIKIARASLRNEFDEEHWSIKRADLISTIERLGIVIK